MPTYTCTMIAYRGREVLATESTSLPTDHELLAEVARIAEAAFGADHIIFVSNSRCYFDSSNTRKIC